LAPTECDDIIEPMGNVYLTSLGCKLNQAETDALARAATAAGHHVVADPEVADLAVVNTCAVTHVAARKSRRLVRSLHRRNASLRVIVTGCYTEMAAERLANMPGVALVVPNRDKDSLWEHIAGELEPYEATPRHAPLTPPPGRTRALVKIQDGCDNVCTYCFVRLARGPQRSRPPDEVLAEVRERVAEGYQEVVLTGVHIGAYGRDSAPGASPPADTGWTLRHLVTRVLEETAIRRLRLSSIEPQDLTEELLALWPNPRLCRHVHLPLQSGCDATLRRMGRAYDVATYLERVEALRRRVPEMAITTDVMVGFPGETTEEYRDTLVTVRRAAFSRLHVFAYSARPGTPAAARTDAVLPAVAKARSHALIALGRELATQYHRALEGCDVQVLFERRDKGGGVRTWNGLTDTYVRVWAPASEDLANRLLTVRCESADHRGVRGRLVKGAV